MTASFSRLLELALISVLSLALVFSPDLFAQDHVVSSSELRQDLQQLSTARQNDLAQLERLFSSGRGQSALATVHMSYQQVDTAVRSLSDADLARLASRAQRAQSDFAAGTISNRDLIWIVVGIAVIILIIVAVRH